MRRSAAPSQQGPVLKKAHFVPPFLSTKSHPVAEHLAKERLGKKSSEAAPSIDVTTRSTRDILHLIQSSTNAETTAPPVSDHEVLPPPLHLSSSTSPSVGPLQLSVVDSIKGSSSGNSGSSSVNSLRKFQTRPQLFEAIRLPHLPPSSSASLSSAVENARSDAGIVKDATTSDGEQASRYFSVMWCKVSKKKHKKWEGDAVLITKGRSVVLMDMEGKEIGRGCGYKLSELQTLTDGQMLVIGGKEIEVMGVLSEDQFKSGKCFQTLVTPGSSDDTASTISSSSSSLRPPGPYSQSFICNGTTEGLN